MTRGLEPVRHEPHREADATGAPRALACAILLAAALGGPGCGSVAWTPERADLLFTSNRDGNPEIYVRRANRREWTNLTRHEGHDNWPVWSPDGERIAFQSRRSGNLDIWVMAADGSGQTQLTDDPEPDYLPAWSPDGRTLIFTSWRVEAGDAERAPHLYTMRADGSTERRLGIASLGTSAGATYSPDGRLIAYSRKSGERGANLHVAASDGSDERRITDGDATYHGSPVFSPDGRWIACYADDGTASALVVMRADGSQARRVLTTGHNWYPRWSPDGRWLVFTAAVDEAQSNIDVFALPLASGAAPLRLASGASREQEASWAPR